VLSVADAAGQPLHGWSDGFLVAPVLPGSNVSSVCFRLTDSAGDPHPVLDDLFDSIEAADAAALAWLEAQRLIDPSAGSVLQLQVLHGYFGVERSTPSGMWRSLRHAGSGTFAAQ
jgi:hypothetical protein